MFIMPLPLIPLLVAGVAAASTAVAGKKGYDSYQNMKEMKELAEQLKSKYDRAYKAFEKSKDATNSTFEEYGEYKLEILNGTMKAFVHEFKKIKNINFTDQAVVDKLDTAQGVEKVIADINKQVVTAGQVITAGVASLAGGGLAAMGALGATTTFAAASTGTAIATLSGIAAQNATLAFLGGGSLAAGGLGVAGGTLVLGGIALAPALAIGSLIFAASTEKKLEEMYAKKAEVNTEVEKLRSASGVMDKIRTTTVSMQELAESTERLFKVNISKMATIINSKGVDFRDYSTEEQKTIHDNYKLAVIMRDILNTTILNEDGNLAPNIQTVITAQHQKLSAF